MKKIISTLSFLFSVLSFSYAQSITFQKTFGGSGIDNGNSVLQTTDGGYIIAGQIFGNGAPNLNVYLIKTNELGDTLWTKTYGGSNDEWALDVQQTSDGGYIAGGLTNSLSGNYADVYLIRTNSTGDTLWTRIFNRQYEDYARSVSQTADGGFIIAGRSDEFSGGNPNMLLMKIDPNGNLLWSKTFGGPNYDEAHSVQQTTDGGYIVAGIYYNDSGGFQPYDIFLVRTDAVGDTLWSKLYGGYNGEAATAVKQTTDGGFIIAGSEYFNAYLVRVNANGDTLWTKSYGESVNYEYPYDVEQTIEGGFILAGYTVVFGAGTNFAFLIKTDENGDTLWTRVIGQSTDNTMCYSVDQTIDKGFILTGSQRPISLSTSDLVLIKVDSNGHTTCNESSKPFPISSPPIEIKSPLTAGTLASFTQDNSLTTVASGSTAVTICSSVGIEEILPMFNALITIYPNPATNHLNVSFGNLEIENLEIVNQLGQIVYSQRFTTQIDVSALPAGVYLLTTYSNHQQVTKMFVKE
jgi:hypothetical protein